MMLIYVFIQKASVGKKSQFQTPPHSPEKAEKKKKIPQGLFNDAS